MIGSAPMNQVKIFKGWPPRDAPSKLVQLWYKSFQNDQRGHMEMKRPTGLSNECLFDCLFVCMFGFRRSDQSLD